MRRHNILNEVPDKPIGLSGMTLFAVLALFAPAIVLAEPGVSHAHVPFLWALSTGMAAGIAFGIIKLTSKTSLMRTPLRR